MNKQVFKLARGSLRNFVAQSRRSYAASSSSSSNSGFRGNTSKGESTAFDKVSQDPTFAKNKKANEQVSSTFDASSEASKKDNVFSTDMPFASSGVGAAAASNMPSDNIGYSTMGLEEKGARIPSPDLHKPQNPNSSSNASYSASVHYDPSGADFSAESTGFKKEKGEKKMTYDKDKSWSSGEKIKQNMGEYDAYDANATMGSEANKWKSDKKSHDSTAKEIKDSITKGTEKLSESVRDYAENAKDSVKHTASKVKDSASSKVEDLKDSAWGAGEAIKDKANEWKEDAKKNLYKAEGYTAAKVENWKDSASATAENVKESVKDKAYDMKDKAADTMEKAKEKVQDAAESVKESANKQYENLSEKTQDTKEYLEEKAYNAAKGTYEFVKDAAKYGLGKMGAGMEKVGHVMKETFIEQPDQQQQQQQQQEGSKKQQQDEWNAKQQFDSEKDKQQQKNWQQQQQKKEKHPGTHEKM